MKRNKDSKRDFEQRLLDELKTIVAERDAEKAREIRDAAAAPAWRRVPRLAFAALAVLAAAAAMLVFDSGGRHAQQAFAVEPQEGGGVTIRVYSLEDAAGLEEALRKAGIRAQVNWLAPGMFCREPHFTPSLVKLPGGGSLGGFTMGGPGQAMTISVGSTQRWRGLFGEHARGEISDEEYRNSIANVNLDPAVFRPDQSVVLSGSPGPYGGDPEGGFEAQLAVAEGRVAPCIPVKGHDGPRTLLTPKDGR